MLLLLEFIEALCSEETCGDAFEYATSTPMETHIFSTPPSRPTEFTCLLFHFLCMKIKLIVLETYYRKLYVSAITAFFKFCFKDIVLG